MERVFDHKVRMRLHGGRTLAALRNAAGVVIVLSDPCGLIDKPIDEVFPITEVTIPAPNRLIQQRDLPSNSRDDEDDPDVSASDWFQDVSARNRRRVYPDREQRQSARNA